jgi:hypothetical protein
MNTITITTNLETYVPREGPNNQQGSNEALPLSPPQRERHLLPNLIGQSARLEPLSAANAGDAVVLDQPVYLGILFFGPPHGSVVGSQIL